jgi:hypothetical protein
MSFLDNLENNVKAMENREERGGRRQTDDVKRREAERAQAKAAAPFAEQLRKGPFSSELLNEATRIGHGLRAKVYITWIDGVLRLEARERRLELKATPKGVVAYYFVNKEPAGSEPVDLNGNAKKLAEKWLSALDARPAGR